MSNLKKEKQKERERRTEMELGPRNNLHKIYMLVCFSELSSLNESK